MVGKWHTYLNFVYDGGSDEVSVLVSGDRNITTVQYQLSSLVHARLDKVQHTLFGCRTNKWAEIWSWLVAYKIIKIW